MARVTWSKTASRAFWDVVGNVELHSPSAALRLGDAIEAASDRLARYPELGRVVPEFGHASLRELIVREHRMIYRVDGDEVTILFVMHGSRDLMRHLPNWPWDIQ